MAQDISSIRNEYLKSSLTDDEILKNPFDQFTKWFDEALQSDEQEASALILGTVDSDNQPSQRTVLLKGFSEDGYVFYTNYQSTKGKQITENPKVNLLFPWFTLQRQIIICGTATKVSKTESEAYFQSRPRGSQLSAYVSNQSEPIASRAVLEKKLNEAEARFKDQSIPLPENWGGYIVKPTSFEFWQGRADRLHDRIFFELDANGNWISSRLSP